jgi:cbb3-type cytochrome c oxidase subunit III
MKRVKLLLAITLSAVFWTACGGGETKNTTANTAPAAPAPAASSSNSNASTPATSMTANANESKEDGAEKKEDKKMEEAKPGQTKPASNVDAAALYTANKCAGCHGADGKGNPKIKGVPDFTDAAWQKKEGDGELAGAIKNGKKPIMPAFGDKLSEAEVKALVAYVRGFAKK